MVTPPPRKNRRPPLRQNGRPPIISLSPLFSIEERGNYFSIKCFYYSLISKSKGNEKLLDSRQQRLKLYTSLCILNGLTTRPLILVIWFYIYTMLYNMHATSRFHIFSHWTHHITSTGHSNQDPPLLCSLHLFINNFRFSFALYLLYPNTLPTFNNCNIHNDTIVQKLPNSWNPNSTTFSISLESHWMKLLTFPH